MKKKYLRSSFSTLDDDAYKTKLQGHIFDAIAPALILGVKTNYKVSSTLDNAKQNLVKTISSNNGEVAAIGEDLKVKFLEQNPEDMLEKSNYLFETNEVLEKVTQKFIGFKNMVIEENSDGAKLVMGNKGSEDEIIAAVLYRFSDLSYLSIREIVLKMDESRKDEVVSQLFMRLKEPDYPMRELEYPYFTFEMVLDSNTYRILRKTINGTVCFQRTTTKHGYDIPDVIANAMCDDVYREIMSRGVNAFNTLKGKWPDDAAYLVPMGFKKKILVKMNLRDVFNFVRDSTFGKYSYEHKKIARQMAMQLKEHYPILAKHLKVNME